MQPENGPYDGNGRLKSARARFGPAGRVLDLFSSVWLGVTLLVLLFFYSSIGSAVHYVRQHPWIEKTEYEWFNWWPFYLVLILFCLNLSVVTIRRIPLRLLNAGVWTIHTGIITLILGSWWYFGTKVEGDAPVFRRRVVIELPDRAEPIHLVAVPGSRTSAIVGPDRWDFSIADTNTDWPILSDEHKGERAYAVNVSVTKTGGASFIRQLLDGYPQYTEDVIPGKGRAVKVVGTKLVDDRVRMRLEYEPQEYFHVMNTWALFTRRSGAEEWHERPIEGIGRYHDRIGARELVFAEEDMPLRPLDVRVPAVDADDPLHDASVRVTGFLRYANMQRRWRDGGPRLNPVLSFSAWSSQGHNERYDLVLLDAQRRRTDTGMAELIWLDDASQLAEIPRSAMSILRIATPATGKTIEVPLTRQTVVGSEGAFTPLEGTELSYRISDVFSDLAIPGADETLSVAMVDVKAPDGEFRRMVADDPARTRDMKEGSDPHGSRQPSERMDPRIAITFERGTAPLVFVVTNAGAIHLLHNEGVQRAMERGVSVGEKVEVLPGFFVRVDALYTHAVQDAKPLVVPENRRQRDVGESLAMIRLEVSSGGSTETKWVSFNSYIFPGAGYAASGRFSYTPSTFRGPDGRPVEVVFSRERRRLPNPVVLDDFELLTQIGGYVPGQMVSIRNYKSHLRFASGDSWSAPVPIEVNSPTDFGGLWYFQATWDPPERGAPGSGMNHTGLGIGNRNGVHVQLAGCCLSVAGMLFAFYVKPILRRRRTQGASLTTAHQEQTTVEAAEPQPAIA